jgi:hypothetical protein
LRDWVDKWPFSEDFQRCRFDPTAPPREIGLGQRAKTMSSEGSLVGSIVGAVMSAIDDCTGSTLDNMSPELKAEAKRVFRLIDTDNGGDLDLGELSRVVGSLSPTIMGVKLDPSDVNNTVDEHQWCILAAKQARQLGEEEIMKQLGLYAVRILRINNPKLVKEVRKSSDSEANGKLRRHRLARMPL